MRGACACRRGLARRQVTPGHRRARVIFTHPIRSPSDGPVPDSQTPMAAYPPSAIQIPTQLENLKKEKKKEKQKSKNQNHTKHHHKTQKETKREQKNKQKERKKKGSPPETPSPLKEKKKKPRNGTWSILTASIWKEAQSDEHHHDWPFRTFRPAWNDNPSTVESKVLYTSPIPTPIPASPFYIFGLLLCPASCFLGKSRRCTGTLPYSTLLYSILFGDW